MSSSRCPHHFDGRAVHSFGQQHRLDGEVPFRLASEAAAEQRVVQGHVLLIDAETLGDVVAGTARALDRGPDLPFVARPARRGGRGLHSHVGEVGRIVFGRDHLGGRSECRVHVALIALESSRLTNILLEHRLVGDRIGRFVWPIVPNDLLSASAALERRPRAVCDNGSTAERCVCRRRRRAVDRDHLLDAWHLHGRAGVV